MIKLFNDFRSLVSRAWSKLKRLIDVVVLPVVARSRTLSSLYYLLFSDAFKREHYAVAYGRYKYNAEAKDNTKNRYLLRRNIHRLEKGLLMRPRRRLFALDYIEITVICYQQYVTAHEQNGEASCELRWAHDVLCEYFAVVADHPLVNKLKKKFRQLPIPQGGNISCIPFKRNLTQPLRVDYDGLMELAQRRKSVRWYLPRPVPRDLIDRAVSLAALAPSACNRQPFRFHVIDDPVLIRKTSSIPMGTGGFDHNIPALAVVVGKLSAFFSERDRHVIYIDASLAAMSFLYALETLGLSSCCINWPDIESKVEQMSSLLKLEPDEFVILLISFGYPDPDGLVAFSQRKPLVELREYNLS